MITERSTADIIWQRPRNPHKVGATVKAVVIQPGLALLLYLIGRNAGASAVDLVDNLRPFSSSSTPPSQHTVRQQVRTLLEAGLIIVDHKGKPRTDLRTQQSYDVVPASWLPPEASRQTTPIATAMKRERGA